MFIQNPKPWIQWNHKPIQAQQTKQLFSGVTQSSPGIWSSSVFSHSHQRVQYIINPFFSTVFKLTTFQNAYSMCITCCDRLAANMNLVCISWKTINQLVVLYLHIIVLEVSHNVNVRSDELCHCHANDATDYAVKLPKLWHFNIHRDATKLKIEEWITKFYFLYSQ